MNATIVLPTQIIIRQLLILFWACLIGISTSTLAQDGEIFKKGEKAANLHHAGNVWLIELNHPDSVFRSGTTAAIFDPGAKLTGICIRADRS